MNLISEKCKYFFLIIYTLTKLKIDVFCFCYRYDGKQFKVQSKEKAQRDKLVHKYKKEMKGAIREIRRDKSYLGKVKIKQQIQRYVYLLRN